MEMTMCRTRNQVTQWEVLSMTHKNDFCNGLSSFYPNRENKTVLEEEGGFCLFKQNYGRLVFILKLEGMFVSFEKTLKEVDAISP